MNLNIDSKTLEMCLKTIDNIGSTTYQNICNGTESIVPWGTMDWLSFLFVALVALIVGLVIIIIAIADRY